MLTTYASPIIDALIAFPFIAFIFTIPYMVFCYRKYGSIIFIRILIVYSFILYLLCAYFLVILPLPSRNEVARLTTARAQLIPFTFIADIVKETIKAHSILNRSIVQVGFNVLLTVPFGMYLKYYFNCSFRKTVILTFCLSLFFELTQLSGLYFIYPRGYRLFDVDDLLLNTLGGLIGYYAVTPLQKLLPTRKEIDEKSLKEGIEVSPVRRLLQLFFDFLVNEFFCLFLETVLKNFNIDFTINHTVILFIYLVMFCSAGICRTVGMTMTNTRLVDYDNNKPSILKIIIRYASMIMIFYGIPALLAGGLRLLENNGIINENLRYTLYIPIIMFWIFIWFYSLVEIFKKKGLVFEGISKTRIITEIKLNKEK